MPHLLGTSKAQPCLSLHSQQKSLSPCHRGQQSPGEKEACSGPCDMEVGKGSRMQAWLTPGTLHSLLCTARQEIPHQTMLEAASATAASPGR